MSSSAIISDGETGCIKVKDDNFTVEWIIKNFSLLPRGSGKRVFSPDFYTVRNEVKCYLSLHPQGVIGHNQGYVAIFLHIEPQTEDFINIKINAEYSILPSGIRKNIQFTYENKTDDGWGHFKLIQRSKLLQLCASDDTVTIRIKINIPRETMDKTEQAFDSQEGRLTQDFRRLFKELPKLSDVVVIVGSQKFPAHKLVLATRSPVFSAMFFNGEIHKNLKNVVEIEKMEPVVVKAMLEFFYTDEVENLEEQVWGLLEAAEKYVIPRLRNMCEKFLYKTLNKENAAEILIHTDLHCSHKLKKLVIEFMADHLSDVVESGSYKEMEEKYPALLKELIRSVALQHKSKKMKLT